MLRIFYDTVIESGRVIDPPQDEQEALEEIELLHGADLLKRVTSRMTDHEQDRTRDQRRRELLKASAGADVVSRVQNVDALVGMNIQDDGYLGFYASPIISEIVDRSLYEALLERAIKDADAKHLMYARKNDCDIFLTLDKKDILPRRTDVERVCANMKVMTPREFVEAWKKKL